MVTAMLENAENIRPIVKTRRVFFFFFPRLVDDTYQNIMRSRLLFQMGRRTRFVCANEKPHSVFYVIDHASECAVSRAKMLVV